MSKGRHTLVLDTTSLRFAPGLVVVKGKIDEEPLVGLCIGKRRHDSLGHNFAGATEVLRKDEFELVADQDGAIPSIGPHAFAASGSLRVGLIRLHGEGGGGWWCNNATTEEDEIDGPGTARWCRKTATDEVEKVSLLKLL